MKMFRLYHGLFVACPYIAYLVTENGEEWTGDEYACRSREDMRDEMSRRETFPVGIYQGNSQSLITCRNKGELARAIWEFFCHR